MLDDCLPDCNCNHCNFNPAKMLEECRPLAFFLEKTSYNLHCFALSYFVNNSGSKGFGVEVLERYAERT